MAKINEKEIRLLFKTFLNENQDEIFKALFEKHKGEIFESFEKSFMDKIRKKQTKATPGVIPPSVISKSSKPSVSSLEKNKTSSVVAKLIKEDDLFEDEDIISSGTRFTKSNKAFGKNKTVVKPEIQNKPSPSQGTVPRKPASKPMNDDIEKEIKIYTGKNIIYECYTGLAHLFVPEKDDLELNVLAKALGLLGMKTPVGKGFLIPKHTFVNVCKSLREKNIEFRKVQKDKKGNYTGCPPPKKENNAGADRNTSVVEKKESIGKSQTQTIKKEEKGKEKEIAESGDETETDNEKEMDNEKEIDNEKETDHESDNETESDEEKKPLAPVKEEKKPLAPVKEEKKPLAPVKEEKKPVKTKPLDQKVTEKTSKTNDVKPSIKSNLIKPSVKPAAVRKNSISAIKNSWGNIQVKGSKIPIIFMQIEKGYKAVGIQDTSSKKKGTDTILPLTDEAIELCKKNGWSYDEEIYSDM